VLIRVWIEDSQPLAGTAAIEGGEPLRFDGWPEYTETLGFQVNTSAASGAEGWLSVVSPEEPDGLELTLHLADEAARAPQATRRQIGRPVFALHTGDCQDEANRLKAKGGVSSRRPRGCPTAA